VSVCNFDAGKNCWHRHNGMSFGLHSFSDLDFADDVALLAELQTMASEAASLRLKVNCRRQTSKLWAAWRMSHQQSQF